MKDWRGMLTVAITMLATAGVAAADQTVVFHVGGFVPRSEDARSPQDCRSGQRQCRDVLSENLRFLDFDLSDFRGPQVGADWLVGIGRYAEAGVGVSFYKRTVPTVYSDFVNRNGSEIAQDLSLRVAPVSATIRLFPAGRDGAVQPYVGAGVSMLSWRYSESGEFVDFDDRSVFRDSYVDSGQTLGGLGLAGVRFAVSDQFGFGGEFRYQGGRATLDDAKGFAGNRLDLGGFSWLFTTHVGF